MRVLIKSVKSDQSEGIPGAGIPERVVEMITEMITGSAASSPLSLISSRFTFVFVLSQFSRPNYLGAWDRLRELGKHTKRDEPPQKH